MVVDPTYLIAPNRFKRLFSARSLIYSSDGISGLQGMTLGNNSQKLRIMRPIGLTVIIWDKLKNLKEEMNQKMKFECSNDRSEILSIVMLK